MATADHAHPRTSGRAHPSALRIGVAALVTLAFVMFEALAGLQGRSLALLSDAGHNLTDVMALAITWYAIRRSARPADHSRTYGYHRTGILAALFNSTTLVLVAGYIFFEAYRRLLAPPVVDSNILIGVGIVAFIINAGTAWLIHGGSRSDLNLRSAFVHLLGDALSTLGAILAGIAIALTGMNWLDPLVSALIGILILWSAWGVLTESIGILLESTPPDIDTAELVSSLVAVDGVNGVHDLHVWSITRGVRALSAHILTDDMAISNSGRIRNEITEILYHHFKIGHATLQLECSGCEPVLLYCDIAGIDALHSGHSGQPTRS